MKKQYLVLGFIAVLAAVWPFLPPFTVTLLSYIGLYAMVALGLVMLTGVGGMTSFGQAAFVGLGAYATAWVCTSPTAAQWLSFLPAGLYPWVGLVLGLLVTALVAWGLGAATLRLSGHYLPLGTIAWGLSLYYIFGNLDWLGGFTGMSNIPPLTVFGLSLASPRLLGVVIWAVLLLAIWALSNLLDSREGRAIRALKGGRVMAEAMGVDTGRARMIIFVIAALLACASGWLYAHMQRFVNPTPFGVHIGIEYLFMAVVGGAGYVWGAIVGAGVITVLKQWLQDWLPSILGASGLRDDRVRHPDGAGAAPGTRGRVADLEETGADARHPQDHRRQRRDPAAAHAPEGRRADPRGQGRHPQVRRPGREQQHEPRGQSR